ncbi:hypothetical protein EDC01DRAFT_780068 [Geopyxis carbonaria]|nr:hypothetical protein EDC01DRAFT_780068 [Geopyxis carbonaria]
MSLPFPRPRPLCRPRARHLPPISFTTPTAIRDYYNALRALPQPVVTTTTTTPTATTAASNVPVSFSVPCEVCAAQAHSTANGHVCLSCGTEVFEAVGTVQQMGGPAPVGVLGMTKRELWWVYKGRGLGPRR